ncbi:hypothetical protein PybrP1_012356 [[Pythium] brassicae (nom. inval.)]|nr:hypothetical protein PybrP1_012356 [[Pythium] brassicae (nom. inval.)]
MGCVHSNAAADLARPNLFQRNLCVHHKLPAAEVYTTLGELGRGAFGVVDRVEHIKTKKQFAMKTLTFASGSKRSEFEKEIDILRGLHHPSIVRMVETFEDGHHFYIIMELASGGTLLDKVKAEGTAPHPAHGFASVFGASTLFRMGMHMHKVLGSVVYMAPEVLEGNYTQSCDLWSLGVIMYMLLSNCTPFHGATEEELIEKIFEAKVGFDKPVWEIVSPDAKSLLKKLLNARGTRDSSAADPATRYTATQVLNHPWIKSGDQPVPPEVYDDFVPQVKAFCQYTPLHRAALVAYAFCMPSKQIRKHSDVYNELNVAHNGILTLQELRNAPALKRFALDMDRVYQALDQQSENGVNLLEFVAATLNADDVSDDETLRTAYSIFDRENSGGITHQSLMALLGKHFDMAACQDMVKRADTDKDGKIGYDDFVSMVKLPTKLSRSRRFSIPGTGSSSLTSKRRSSEGEKTSRRSLAVRRTSSAQLDSLDKAAATEIALGTREDALKKIQALREDVELASQHSAQHSTPERSAEPSQVEICVAEPVLVVAAPAPVLAVS